MPFEKIPNKKLSLFIVNQIEQMILRGILRPGTRLPAERNLADRLGVSRPSLRDAISILTNNGLLETKVGSGVFVANVLGNAFSPALVNLFKSHDEAVFDYISFRRDIEGIAAERAAKQASEADLDVIKKIFEKMVTAHHKRDNSRQESSLDAEFHLSIIEASHNVVMLHMMRSMYDLLKEGVFYNRQALFVNKSNRQVLLEQHEKILINLINRDAHASRISAEAHLDFISQTLQENMIAAKHEEFAQKRLEIEILQKNSS